MIDEFIQNLAKIAWRIGTHFVVIKFSMLFAHHRVKGDELVYQLSKETLEVIQSSLENA
jgi:hypothetical protein